MNVLRAKSSYFKLNGKYMFAWRVYIGALDNGHTHVEILLMNKNTGRAWKATFPASKFADHVTSTILISCGPDGTPTTGKTVKYGNQFEEVKLLDALPPEWPSKPVCVTMTMAQFKAMMDTVNHVIDTTDSISKHQTALLAKSGLV